MRVFVVVVVVSSFSSGLLNLVQINLLHIIQPWLSEAHFH